jgi:hypothetical protein
MPRYPLAGLGFLAVGGACAGVLTLMLTWAAMVLLDPAEALEWGTAVAEHTFDLRGAAAESRAGQYVNPRLAGMLILLSFIPFWFARRGLALAYANLLPLGVSVDGLMRVEFSEPPRIGGRARGCIPLGQKPRPGETFALKLSCERQQPAAIQAPGAEWEIVEVHVETREATAELAGGRWVLNFDFEVPSSLPHTAHGMERLRYFLPLAKNRAASWAIQATDASGDHVIEFDMAREARDPVLVSTREVSG